MLPDILWTGVGRSMSLAWPTATAIDQHFTAFAVLLSHSCWLQCMHHIPVVLSTSRRKTESPRMTNGWTRCSFRTMALTIRSISACGLLLKASFKFFFDLSWHVVQHKADKGQPRGLLQSSV